MNRTLTIDEDSEPGSWVRALSKCPVVLGHFQWRAFDLRSADRPDASKPTAMDPRCARCGAALCNHSDAEWKG